MKTLVWSGGLLVAILGGCVQSEPDWAWRERQADAIREAAFRHYLEGYLSREHLRHFPAELPVFLAVGGGAPSEKVMRGLRELGPGVKSLSDCPAGVGTGSGDAVERESLGIVRITWIKWFGDKEAEVDVCFEYRQSSTQYFYAVAGEDGRWVVRATRRGVSTN